MYIVDVARFIHGDEEGLDMAISQYLSSQGLSHTPDGWRLENYALLRGWAYPPQADYLDAVVKLNATDSLLVAEGGTELSDYYQRCLAVKHRFPKPQEVPTG